MVWLFASSLPNLVADSNTSLLGTSSSYYYNSLRAVDCARDCLKIDLFSYFQAEKNKVDSMSVYKCEAFCYYCCFVSHELGSHRAVFWRWCSYVGTALPVVVFKLITCVEDENIIVIDASVFAFNVCDWTLALFKSARAYSSSRSLCHWREGEREEL